MTQNTVFGIRGKRKSEILCLIISVNFEIRGICNFKNIVLKLPANRSHGVHQSLEKHVWDNSKTRIDENTCFRVFGQLRAGGKTQRLFLSFRPTS